MAIFRSFRSIILISIVIFVLLAPSISATKGKGKYNKSQSQRNKSVKATTNSSNLPVSTPISNSNTKISDVGTAPSETDEFFTAAIQNTIDTHIFLPMVLTVILYPYDLHALCKTEEVLNEGPVYSSGNIMHLERGSIFLEFVVNKFGLTREQFLESIKSQSFVNAFAEFNNKELRKVLEDLFGFLLNQHLKDEHGQYIRDELYKLLKDEVNSKENVIEYAKKIVDDNKSDPKYQKIKEIYKIKDDVIAYSKIFIDNIHIQYVVDELYNLLKDEPDSKENVIEYARTIIDGKQVDHSKYQTIMNILKINDDIISYSKFFISENPIQNFKDELYKQLKDGVVAKDSIIEYAKAIIDDNQVSHAKYSIIKNILEIKDDVESAKNFFIKYQNKHDKYQVVKDILNLMYFIPDYEEIIREHDQVMAIRIVYGLNPKENVSEDALLNSIFKQRKENKQEEQKRSSKQDDEHKKLNKKDEEQRKKLIKQEEQYYQFFNDFMRVFNKAKTLIAKETDVKVIKHFIDTFRVVREHFIKEVNLLKKVHNIDHGDEDIKNKFNQIMRVIDCRYSLEILEKAAGTEAKSQPPATDKPSPKQPAKKENDTITRKKTDKVRFGRVEEIPASPKNNTPEATPNGAQKAAEVIQNKTPAAIISSPNDPDEPNKKEVSRQVEISSSTVSEKDDSSTLESLSYPESPIVDIIIDPETNTIKVDQVNTFGGINPNEVTTTVQKPTTVNEKNSFEPSTLNSKVQPNKKGSMPLKNEPKGHSNDKNPPSKRIRKEYLQAKNELNERRKNAASFDYSFLKSGNDKQKESGSTDEQKPIIPSPVDVSSSIAKLQTMDNDNLDKQTFSTAKNSKPAAKEVKITKDNIHNFVIFDQFGWAAPKAEECVEVFLTACQSPIPGFTTFIPISPELYDFFNNTGKPSGLFNKLKLERFRKKGTRFGQELIDLWRPAKKIVETWSLTQQNKSSQDDDLIEKWLKELSKNDELLFNRLLIRLFYSAPLPPTKESYSYKKFDFKVQISRKSKPLIHMGSLLIPELKEEKFYSYVEEAVYPPKYYKQLLDERTEAAARAKKEAIRKAQDAAKSKIIVSSVDNTTSSDSLASPQSNPKVDLTAYDLTEISSSFPSEKDGSEMKEPLEVSNLSTSLEQAEEPSDTLSSREETHELKEIKNIESPPPIPSNETTSESVDETESEPNCPHSVDSIQRVENARNVLCVEQMMNMIPYEGGIPDLFDESNYEKPNRILLKFAIVEALTDSLNSFCRFSYPLCNVFSIVFGSSVSFCGDESDVDLVFAFEGIPFFKIFLSLLDKFLSIHKLKDFELKGWELRALNRYNSLPGVKKIEEIVPLNGRFRIVKYNIINSNTSMLMKLQISIFGSAYLRSRGGEASLISFDLSVHEFPLEKYRGITKNPLNLPFIDIKTQEQFYLIPDGYSYTDVIFKSPIYPSSYRTRLGGVFALENIKNDVLACGCSLGVFYQLNRFFKKFLMLKEIYGQTRGYFSSTFSLIVCVYVIQLAKKEGLDMDTRILIPRLFKFIIDKFSIKFTSKGVIVPKANPMENIISLGLVNEEFNEELVDRIGANIYANLSLPVVVHRIPGIEPFVVNDKVTISSLLILQRFVEEAQAQLAKSAGIDHLPFNSLLSPCIISYSVELSHFLETE